MKKHQIRSVFKFLLLAMAFGAVVGGGFTTATVGRWQPTAEQLLMGMIIGSLIAFCCGFFDLSLQRFYSRIPFTVFLLLKTVAYVFSGLAVMALMGWLRPELGRGLMADPGRLASVVVFTLVMSFIVNLFMAMRHMLGKQALLYFFAGRYHTPVEEIRAFLFVDLTSSTQLAEQIGEVNYHVLINRFCCDISDAIVAHRGEIYKYVGDEVIVTWPVSKVRSDDRWLECYFHICECIDRKKEEYIRQFEIHPRFRASIHCGTVVVGEMGYHKREIGFFGDTVNTAARILDTCKKQDKSLLVSEEVVQRISQKSRYIVQSLAEEVALAGKKNRIPLYSVGRA